MESNNVSNWKVGEIHALPWTSTVIKKSGSTTYKHYYSSRFICIREENGEQPGILLKVLGKASASEIMMVSGEPFCKDDKDDLLKGKVYSSFRFPALEELAEVLGVFRENPKLTAMLDEAGMHLSPGSTFWVREAHKTLFQTKPQFYDAGAGTLSTSPDDASHYRLSILYFHKGKLTY